MNTTIKLVVRNIIGEPINGYVRVTVANDLFKTIAGFRPSIAYTAMGDSGGNGVRIFDIDGVKLFSKYNKETAKTTFIMKTEDARAKLVTVAQERATEAKLPFNISSFAPVATA